MIDGVSDALRRAANLGIDSDADFLATLWLAAGLRMRNWYTKIPIYLRNPELLSTVQ